MFEQFIKAGGDKDQFVRRFMLKKTSESTNQLDEEGGYYTPDEMKKLLNYSSTDLVDKNIKYYWCRTRVKGLKRLRQTQTAEETAEAEGTGPMMLSGLDKNACLPSTMGIRTAADVEGVKTEEEKLDIQQKELLGMQEKCSNLLDKLSGVPDEKKDRANQLRPKLEEMSKSAEKLYERMAESVAKLHTKQLDIKTPEGNKLILDLTTEGKKLPGCCMWTGLDRPVLRKPPKKKEEDDEVPCSKMVGLAKAMTADGLTASGSGFINELSKVSEKDAEEKAHKLLQKHKLSLPIPLRNVHGDPAIQGFPRLKPLDILQHMADSGHLNKLLGGRSVQSSHLLLLSFWENYRAIHPDFELFSSHHSDIPLEDCIPIVAHIDGGRGYKKSEFMIFDWAAIIGSGSGKKNKKDPAVRAFRSRGYKMQLPLLGHSYNSHFLYAAMPSSFHKNQEDSFQALLRTFAEDLRECFDEGISWKGRVLRLVCLGLKGDLKLQARAGRLTRWFTTARKAPYSETAKGSGQCCWLCSAGDVTAPFEEIHSDNPVWLQQMPEFTTPPWRPGLEGGMLRPSLCYLDRPAKFYLADLFHIYLAGVGQDFCSSCLVYMLPICFAGDQGNNSVDAQIENLNSESVHLTAFTRDKLQFFDASSTFPSGTWSKAADTARIMKFIVYVCDEHKDTLNDDKIMLYMYRAALAITRFMQALYASDLWVDSEFHVA
ncbi:UPF1 [Symbiodinium sp. CCMP2592]|nr:UPF1 [Symbiodinium sp. CCMP2592]